jgi:hypothetical protein
VAVVVVNIRTEVLVGYFLILALLKVPQAYIVYMDKEAVEVQSLLQDPLLQQD